MKKRKENPCLHCRVGDSKTCDNKNCKRWQAWFLGRWENIHGYWKQYGKERMG